MIKNILKSKLFVLCSMLFCSLVVSVFFFGTSSKAYSNSDLQTIKSKFYTKFGVNISDNFAAQVLTYWENHNSTYPLMYCTKNTNTGNYTFQYARYVVSDAGTSMDINGIYTGNYVNNYTGTVQFDPYNVGNATFSINISNGIKFGTWSDFHQEDIDWNSPFYSANIPNPNMYVSYRNLSSTPVIDVPLNVSVASFPVGQNVTEYYVQMFALVNMDFNYYVQNTRDGIVYNGLDMEKWTTYFDVVTPQDFKTASDLSEDYIHLALTNGWYNNYPQDSSFNFSFADGIPSNLQTSAITKFHNFRKNATFADNTVYLYVRYFTIDEDNNFVVGSWTVWKSYNPNEFYAELPSYYVPYTIVPGTQGTSSNVNPVSTASPEPGIIVNPVNTNPSVNITVTQNVPNYPDYPTIASYNKDNLLVDTMNSLNSFTQFFGDFGLFLTVAFGFIPEWIWGIIGVGFSLSIIVMFLKIL